MEFAKVLITGGLGFIGRVIAAQLVARKCRVLLFDNLSVQIHGAIPDFTSAALLHSAYAEVFRGDVNKPNHWAAVLNQVDAVIHLAANTGTAQSMYEISQYVDTNIGGTAMLLDYLANHKHKVKKVILGSSRAVYGEGAYRCPACGVVYPSARSQETLEVGQWEPVCPGCHCQIDVVATAEDAKTDPASVYAVSKLAQEHLVRVGARALGIPAVIFRFQNVYGEGQSLRNPYTGILSIFSTQLRLGKTVRVYEDGRETRDFVHVSDVGRAVVAGLFSDKGDGVTLNVGSGKPTSIKRVADLLGERFSTKLEPLISGEYRLGDIRHGYADLSAVHSHLHFVPQVDLEQGLTRFADWVKTQPVEPDRLDQAVAELTSRGLMPGEATHSGGDHARAKAASV